MKLGAGSVGIAEVICVLGVMLLRTVSCTSARDDRYWSPALVANFPSSDIGSILGGG
jgi:hypothetical protein